MGAPVFISYARSASSNEAKSLAASLGDLAFLDTELIDDGDQFPERLASGILNSRLVVVFATNAYLERRFCRLEMRLALAAGNSVTSRIVAALGEGCDSVLEMLPPELAATNWPDAEATQRLDALVRLRLQGVPQTVRASLGEDNARRLTTAFLEEAKAPEPQSLEGIRCSFPTGAALESIGGRFVGRSGDIRRIHRALSHEGRGRAHAVARISAGPGYGKTRAAIEYLHRHAQNYPGGIFWIDAASGELESEYWRVLSAIDPTIPELKAMRQQGRDPRRELERALRNLGKPALYIIDNIPEAEMGEDPPAIADFCPATGAITILATSRQDTKEQAVTSIPLDKLERDSAILLLTEDMQGVGALTWIEWGRLAEWVGDLPIALDVLNRSLALSAVPARDLLARMDALEDPNAAVAVDRLREALRGQLPKGAVHGVTEAFSISLEKLDGVTQRSAVLLAQLAAEPVPEAFMQALPPELNASAVRAGLKSRHFVTGGGDLAFGVMHRLMADFLRAYAKQSAADNLCQATTVLSSVLEPERCKDPREWPVMKLCRPHAEALAERGLRLPEPRPATAELALRAGILAAEQGDYAGARRLEEQAVSMRTSIFGKDHPQTLEAATSLGVTLSAAGDFADARRILERVIESSTRTLGAEAGLTLAAMNNLGKTLSDLGDYAGARRTYEQVVQSKNRILGEEDPSTLISVGNLATALLAGGDYESARTQLTTAVETMSRVLGPEHPLTLVSMGNLAEAARNQGDYPAARRLQESVLEIEKRLLGAEHPETLKAMNNLAETLSSQGDPTAREMLEHTLEIRTRVLGEDHPDTLLSMNNVAGKLGSEGDYAGARQLLERLLKISESVLGPEHPRTLSALNNIAEVVSAQGDYVEARRLHEQALEATARTLGPEHPDTLNSMCNLARTTAQGGDFAAARQLQASALDSCGRVLGYDHPTTLAAAGNLAWILKAQGELANACKLQEWIVDTTRQRFGEDHPSTLIAMSSLADARREGGDAEAARDLRGQVLEKMTRTLGDAHPTSIRLLKELASSAAAQGDTGIARQLQERLVAASKHLLGEEHPATLSAMSLLGLTLLGLGDIGAAEAVQREALAGSLRVLGERHTETFQALNNMGLILARAGDLAGARASFERLLELTEQHLGRDHQYTMTAMESLASVLARLEDFPAARKIQLRVLEANLKSLGMNHPKTLRCMSNLGHILAALGDNEGAQHYQSLAATLEALALLSGSMAPGDAQFMEGPTTFEEMAASMKQGGDSDAGDAANAEDAPKSDAAGGNE